MTVIPFEARRFRSTAAYYTRYRVPYPDELIARVAERAACKLASACSTSAAAPASSASPSPA